MPYNSSKMIFFSVFAYLIFLVRISLQYPTLPPPPPHLRIHFSSLHIT